MGLTVTVKDITETKSYSSDAPLPSITYRTVRDIRVEARCNGLSAAALMEFVDKLKELKAPPGTGIAHQFTAVSTIGCLVANWNLVLKEGTEDIVEEKSR